MLCSSEALGWSALLSSSASCVLLLPVVYTCDSPSVACLRLRETLPTSTDRMQCLGISLPPANDWQVQ